MRAIKQGLTRGLTLLIMSCAWACIKLQGEGK
jgi:hypothetical protein